MRINKDKSVGTVIFIVEGLRTEFSLLTLALLELQILEIEESDGFQDVYIPATY